LKRGAGYGPFGPKKGLSNVIVIKRGQRGHILPPKTRVFHKRAYGEKS